MAEEVYYGKKLELEREYYKRKLELEFSTKEMKKLEEDSHWKEFEHSAGVAAASVTMTIISIGKQEGLEASVAALTTVCATVRATSALAILSGAKTVNIAKSIFR